MGPPTAVSPDHRRGEDRRGALALTALGPIWGYGWVVSKVALGYSEPFAFAALYVPLSAGCLLLALALTRRSLRPPPLLSTALVGVLQTTLFTGLVIVALSIGGAGKVAILSYTMPFWLLLLAWVFLGEELRGLRWPAVGLAFAGLVLVVQPWRTGSLLSGVLACLGGLAWAASALVVKLLQRRRAVDVVSLTAWQMAIGSIPLVAIAVLARGGVQWTPSFVAALTYTVLLASMLAWTLWFIALRSLAAGLAGLGTLAVPVVGALAAWLQLGERPSAVEAAGMGLILAGLAVLAAAGLRIGGHGAAVRESARRGQEARRS
jgi:drug/metabolite transporter (DMT)-like permease